MRQQCFGVVEDPRVAGVDGCVGRGGWAVGGVVVESDAVLWVLCAGVVFGGWWDGVVGVVEVDDVDSGDGLRGVVRAGVGDGEVVGGGVAGEFVIVGDEVGVGADAVFVGEGVVVGEVDDDDGAGGRALSAEGGGDDVVAGDGVEVGAWGKGLFYVGMSDARGSGGEAVAAGVGVVGVQVAEKGLAAVVAVVIGTDAGGVCVWRTAVGGGAVGRPWRVPEGPAVTGPGSDPAAGSSRLRKPLSLATL